MCVDSDIGPLGIYSINESGEARAKTRGPALGIHIFLGHISKQLDESGMLEANQSRGSNIDAQVVMGLPWRLCA